MTGTIEKRVEALEASQSLSEPVTWIITFVAPGRLDAEPGRADVGGRTIHRTDSETGEGFLARVAAEAKLAAKPGCRGLLAEASSAMLSYENNQRKSLYPSSDPSS